MDQNQLDRFKRWFDDYTNRFLGDDAYVNANLQLKQQHTKRTCAEIMLLARELALDDNQTRMAELIALFHDIGRFPQFVEHRTYHDPRSVNHCQLGVEVLRKEGLLETLPEEERQWVQTAVQYHGCKSLPPQLRGLTLLFTKLIRDADKIDIFRVVLDGYRRYQEDPDGFMLEIELADDPEYSPAVLEAVMNERLVDYGTLRTITDGQLCQLGWVYDLNFTASLRRVDQCGFLRQLMAFLPTDDKIQLVCRKISQYVQDRLTQDSQP